MFGVLWVAGWVYSFYPGGGRASLKISKAIFGHVREFLRFRYDLDTQLVRFGSEFARNWLMVGKFGYDLARISDVTGMFGPCFTNLQGH